MDNSDQIIKEQIKNAPPEIKQLLKNDSWRVAIPNITQKANFSPEQVTSFENEVLFVLLGMDYKDNFEKNIQASVLITPSTAHAISEEVNQKIFNGVVEFLPQSGADAVGRINSLMGSPTGLKGASNELLSPNLPTSPAQNFSGSLGGQATALEEKIMPHIGTPGEKIAWEQRKQQVGDKIVVQSGYQNNDPYREPLQ
jgi:hypothetical protein